MDFIEETLNAIAESERAGTPIVAGHWKVSSLFQPALSVSESQIVMHEALLKAENMNGTHVSPVTVLTFERDMFSRLITDRWLSIMHLHNWKKLHGEGVLSLNLIPEAVISLSAQIDFLSETMYRLGIKNSSVCLEIPEPLIRDDDILSSFVSMARNEGFLVAFDNFASRECRFDRIWRCLPDMVKLDRPFVHESSVLPKNVARNMLTAISGCGVRTVIQGIETMEESLCFMEHGADMVQGFYFEYPSQTPLPKDFVPPMMPNLWSVMASKKARKDSDDMLMSAFKKVLSSLAAGKSLEESSVPLKDLGLLNAFVCSSLGVRKTGDTNSKVNWSCVDGFGKSVLCKKEVFVSARKRHPVSGAKVRYLMGSFTDKSDPSGVSVLIAEFASPDM